MEEFKSYNDYLMSLPEDYRKIIKEANKIKQRFNRHGADVVNSCGRKKLSEEHKKEKKRLYNKKRYEKIKQEKIKNGTYKPRGRPRKKVVEEKKY